MKFEKTFLRSKVAQRIALLFILCTLIPVVTLAVLSIDHVTKNLREQSLIRLQQTGKTLSMAIYERLLFLETDMIRAASRLREIDELTDAFPPTDMEDYKSGRFKGIVLHTDTGEPVPLFGSVSPLPEMSKEEMRLILQGNTFLSTLIPEEGRPHIYLLRAIDPDSPGLGILQAEVEPFYLWFMGYETALPARTDLIILDHQKNILYSSLPASSGLAEVISSREFESSSGQFEWTYYGKNHLASYKDIYLQPNFRTSHWTVITNESKDSVYMPIVYFKRTFFLVILLSLWIVIFLSFSQIRQSLIPLEKLKAGAQRIAKRDFSTKVIITSRDEFADVAKTFNAMSYQLGKQFKTLTTIAEIDRAILSAFKTEDIVATLLNRICDVFPSDITGVTLLDKHNPKRGMIYEGNNGSGERKKGETLKLSEKDIRELYEHRENRYLEVENSPKSYLAPLIRKGIESFLIFPIFLNDTLAGIISFGSANKPKCQEEDLAQARQLADQVGVALSNARLIEDLSDFNWGTLKALARAIDAKSPWTAGHSERVTKFGLEIGKEMGFPEKEMDILRRGGLLHDIGKLGIPNKILDKPGKLTEKDRKVLQKHPRLGARILEPISAYTDIMLIVLQHHENFDGTGYPDGLAGEEISIYSRIFAVADRFEALTSDRPYRKAIHPTKAIKKIHANSDKEFDPSVVEAFIRCLKKNQPHHFLPIDGSWPEYSLRISK